MNWPAVLQTKTRRVLALFALAELSLVIAIPFLAVAGVTTILGSRSGAFVQQVGPSEPGWVALVEPSSVAAVVEYYQGQLTGVTLVVYEQEVQGGAVVVIPGNVVIDGNTLQEMPPDDVLPALSESLKLRIDESVVVDETAWPQILGEQRYTINNTDLVEVDSATSFSVGELVVDGDNAGAFIGSQPERVDSTVLLSRRLLFWTAIVESPPMSNHLIASKAQTLNQGNVDVFRFPEEHQQGDPIIDDQNSVGLVSRAVPFPAGAQPEHRVRVRVLDRTGEADLLAIASQLAAGGFEVVEIGNASEFDDDPSELVVPSQWTGPDPSLLAEFVNVDSVVDPVDEPRSVATLLVGDDFSLNSA